MVSRDIIQRLLAIINDTRARLNTLESREVALLTATQTLTNKTLTTPTIGNYTNAQHAHTNAASGGTISHGSLTGLTNGDPHTQYLLKSTYDANTILKADSDDTPVALTVGASTIVGRASTGNITALTASQVASIVQGSIDHGSITGLADDDHTGYARLTGRSGGQTLIGGTAANDDLTLEGTSNATRTTSYVVIQPNGGNVGIGTASPTARLEIRGAGTTSATTALKVDNSSGDPLLVVRNDGAATFSSTVTAAQFSASANGVAGIFTTQGSGNGYGLMAMGNNATGARDIFQAGVLGYSNGFGVQYTGSDMRYYFIDGNVGIGTASPDTRLDIDAGAIEFAEMTAPAAGAANTGRLFCRDNGSGKTQLCVIFNTGAIQVIATQP